MDQAVSVPLGNLLDMHSQDLPLTCVNSASTRGLRVGVMVQEHCYADVLLRQVHRVVLGTKLILNIALRFFDFLRESFPIQNSK